VPSAGGIFGDLTVDENMEFVADANRLHDWRSTADTLLERATLHGFADRISGRLSGGKRHKLTGAMTLLPKPDLLVLDESSYRPRPGEPNGTVAPDRAGGAVAEGAAVAASTTELDEAERATSVLLLHNG